MIPNPYPATSPHQVQQELKRARLDKQKKKHQQSCEKNRSKRRNKNKKK